MRYALGIEYEGTDFLGWQRLRHGRSVQRCLEEALSKVADHPIEVTCAGRTDSGVHALCQVVHFDSEAPRSGHAWLMGCNSQLPASTAVRWVQPVDPSFHARYGAVGRRYRYRILNRKARAGLMARHVCWERRPLDAEAMQRAALALIGEHDFSAFRTVHCQAARPNRHVRELQVGRQGDEVVIDIEANAFLHHMVRNIVGSLLPVGRGDRPEDWLAELLQGRDRAKAGITAPAQGLCFLGPRYPALFGLPSEVCA